MAKSDSECSSSSSTSSTSSSGSGSDTHEVKVKAIKVELDSEIEAIILKEEKTKKKVADPEIKQEDEGQPKTEKGLAPHAEDEVNERRRRSDVVKKDRKPKPKEKKRAEKHSESETSSSTSSGESSSGSSSSSSSSESEPEEEKSAEKNKTKVKKELTEVLQEKAVIVEVVILEKNFNEGENKVLQEAVPVLDTPVPEIEVVPEEKPHHVEEPQKKEEENPTSEPKESEISNEDIAGKNTEKLDETEKPVETEKPDEAEKPQTTTKEKEETAVTPRARSRTPKRKRRSPSRSHSRDRQRRHRSPSRSRTRSRERRRRRSRSRSYERERSTRRRSASVERRREERKRRHAEREKREEEENKVKRSRRHDTERDQSPPINEKDARTKSATAAADKDKENDNSTVTDPKAKITERQRRTVDLLTSRTGGAYIPPAKLRMMQAGITDKSSAAYQRIAWEALKKSIHGYINKVNVDNIAIITRELLKENIVRGRGLLCRSIIQAQAASPTFTHVYAALVSIINSKFPNIGELLLKRLVIQFKRAFRRNDKAVCLSASRFVAHLVNQRVAHEILALEILTLLVETPTDDSVEVAIAFLKECGMKLTEVSSKGIGAIFEMLKNILHEGKLDKRVQYMIEVVFQVRKDGFKDHQSVVESLELVEEDDQFTHLLMLDEATTTEDILNVFKFDDNYAINEDKYKGLSKEILGSDASGSGGSSSGSGSDSDDSENSDGDGKGEEKTTAGDIIDNTETNLIALRRTIYLTINSSLDYEECAHKLMKMQLKPGQEIELCHMFLDCCAEQRTYEKFYGLLAQRFCSINKIYIGPFEEIYKDTYQTTHRLDTNRLRNVSKFFAHLLFTDAISWDVLDCIKLNEDDTTSSSRIFIKILFQELAEYMGLGKLNSKLKEEVLVESLAGLFPKDNPRNTRFAINFFTSIGLGGLTDELRHFLKNAPKSVPAINAEILGNKPVDVDSSSSSSSSSSDSSSSASESSSSSSSSDSDSSDSEEDKKKKKRKQKTKKTSKTKSKNGKTKSKKEKKSTKNGKKRKNKKTSSEEESSSSSSSDSRSDSTSSSSSEDDKRKKRKKRPSKDSKKEKAAKKHKKSANDEVAEETAGRRQQQYNNGTDNRRERQRDEEERDREQRGRRDRDRDSDRGKDRDHNRKKDRNVERERDRERGRDREQERDRGRGDRDRDARDEDRQRDRRRIGSKERG